MNPKIKKWIPFILLISIVVVAGTYMFLSTLKSAYIPTTDNPAQIYREACSGCHGLQGEGKGLFPALAEHRIGTMQVQKIVTDGAVMMPAFEHLRGDTLKKMADYVRQHKFSE